jgi:acetyltransferase-like isoleucine patch superfamily enzyme
MKKEIQKPKIFKLASKFEILFFWLRLLFYPKSKGVNILYLLIYFIPQKILRINGSVKWPVHFTSLILHQKNIQIGNNSPIGLNTGCYIQGKGGIVIGHNLRMGPNVGLISANHSTDDYDIWIDVGPIEIGNNVWIGMNSVVMPGVKVGNNVIIGANSTVTNNIPDNSIALGSPCKVVKSKAEYKGFDFSKI